MEVGTTELSPIGTDAGRNQGTLSNRIDAGRYKELYPIGIDEGRNQGTLCNRDRCRWEPRNSLQQK